MFGQALASEMFLSLSIPLVSINFKSGNITLVVKARQIGGIFRFYYFLKLLFIYQENN